MEILLGCTDIMKKSFPSYGKKKSLINPLKSKQDRKQQKKRKLKYLKMVVN